MKNDRSKNIDEVAAEPKQTRFIPVSKWNEFHEWPPVGGMRHLIFFRNENGFAKVLKRPKELSKNKLNIFKLIAA